MAKGATSFKKLMEYHDVEVLSRVNKYLSNINYNFNPNDVAWLLESPQLEKQMGRSARVYKRIEELDSER